MQKVQVADPECYGADPRGHRAAAAIYAREMREKTPEHEISPERASTLLAAGEAQIIDVRQDAEWEQSRIAGAKHIPLEQLPARAEAEIDPDRPIVFQCRSGARSGMATDAFRAAGREAFNLAGGLEAWVGSGLPVEPEGTPVAEPMADNS